MSDQKHKSLTALVAIYQRQFGPKLAEYLDYFRRVGSLNDAIERAARARGLDDKITRHQRRAGKEILEKASHELLRHADEIKACHSFDELPACVGKHTNDIYRFGVLAVYDTSLRIGAHLNKWPSVV